MTQGGTGIEYCEQGSTGGGFVDIDIGGTLRQLTPGDKLTGLNFATAKIRRNSGSVQVGTAKFWIYKGTADHRNESKSGGSKSPLAVYDEANGTNTGCLLTRAAPTLISEGVNVSAGQWFWAWVQVVAGQTITGGGMDIYRWDTASGLWVPIMNVAFPLTGKVTAGIPQDWSGVQSGRLFAAPNAVTVSGAATAIDLHMRAR